jgi:hypothetical protein
MHFYLKKRKACLLSLYVALTVILCSCPRPTIPPPTGDATMTVTVPNPQWLSTVGYGVNLDPNNYVNIKLTIAVKTMSGSQAIPWGTTFYKTYIQDNSLGHIDASFTNNITVPRDAIFIIEVTTEGKECTTVNAVTTNCPAPNNHTTYQFYTGLNTFSANAFSNFTFGNLVKDYDECCQ